MKDIAMRLLSKRYQTLQSLDKVENHIKGHSLLGVNVLRLREKGHLLTKPDGSRGIRLYLPKLGDDLYCTLKQTSREPGEKDICDLEFKYITNGNVLEADYMQENEGINITPKRPTQDSRRVGHPDADERRNCKSIEMWFKLGATYGAEAAARSPCLVYDDTARVIEIIQKTLHRVSSSFVEQHQKFYFEPGLHEFHVDVITSRYAGQKDSFLSIPAEGWSLYDVGSDSRVIEALAGHYNDVKLTRYLNDPSSTLDKIEYRDRSLPIWCAIGGCDAYASKVYRKDANKKYCISRLEVQVFKMAKLLHEKKGDVACRDKDSYVDLISRAQPIVWGIQRSVFGDLFLSVSQVDCDAAFRDLLIETLPNRGYVVWLHYLKHNRSLPELRSVVADREIAALKDAGVIVSNRIPGEKEAVYSRGKAVTRRLGLAKMKEHSFLLPADGSIKLRSRNRD